MPGPFYVLTVSGSDSSGGAGLQADNRAILAADAFPLNVITAVTVQTSAGVRAVQSVPADFVARQLHELLQAYPVAAVKSGMLVDVEIVEVLASAFEMYPRVKYVCDPVLRASSGRSLLTSDGVALLREQLMPRAILTTPNLEELAILSGQTEPDLSAGQTLAQELGQAILLKGGHASGSECSDWLIRPDAEPQCFNAPRIQSKNTRGTGCALASGIAARIAQGVPLSMAIENAKAQLQESLQAHIGEDWTGDGPGFL
ncbi:bifunctional hydroxymethylpyrimidine kinase/phosphomethylpyrimidine kinase [Pelagicoccus sp. SDUM812002]|uniref:bifunctional hydroxymethylpyrimidine kinase/phosphomethylpyrimidine kinase n=1 Tax=Pelagicoccus sp. SDUM812002 TaxID=3041266 RepID=UPI00280CB30D|nr:bifunctional hydroxymethylpyrimidine kinase/phosphomethylpyrimidine kinase [Pelagicoccus sp. SDUM812002]MDQ8184771.1 bifunctional hydroxymethylpyrimidine kinase/phosphomethylpyrimidine kinase [Pelagicoccus sp. SDUM812002]